MTFNPATPDLAGGLVQITRWGNEIHIRRQSVSDPSDWLEVRMPSTSAATAAERITALAAALRDAIPDDGEDGDE